MGLHKSNCLLLLVLVALTIIKTNQADSGDSQSRLSLARCNYTEVGARSCASCQEVMLCTPLNVGVVSRCRGDRRHCNQGSCSDTPTPNCNNTSSQRRRISGSFSIRF